MENTRYSIRTIVSIRYKEEAESSYYHYVPKTKRFLFIPVVRKGWHSGAFFYGSDCPEPDRLFLRDGKVYVRAHLRIEFSNRDFENLYFENDADASKAEADILDEMGPHIVQSNGKTYVIR